MARRALLIAADEYEDPGYGELRAPVADVEALRTALGDPTCGRFEVCEPLLNRDAQTLRVELEDFFNNAAYEDQLLLYIAGHGELRGGRLYFATTPTERHRLRATALADSFIHDLMEHAAAQFVVLVLDCCHSGAFGRGIPRASEVELAERFGGSGRVTLAASAQIEYAFEEEAVVATDQRLPSSFFTAALVEGLRRADADEDGIVTLDALYRFVSDEVRRRNPQQTPRLLGDRSGQITMAFRPHRSADARAPDGADVWVGASGVHGTMSRFELARGATSMAVMHRTVEEIWHVISGHGAMWRADDHGDEFIHLEPEMTVVIPAGMRFQVRVGDARPLKIVAVTMPPWPGDREATAVDGPWTPLNRRRH